MRLPHETDRALILRLIGVDHEIIERGHPSHRNYLTDSTSQALRETREKFLAEDLKRRQSELNMDFDESVDRLHNMYDEENTTRTWRTVRCQTCGQKIRCKRSEGETVRCWRCGQINSVPFKQTITGGEVIYINPPDADTTRRVLMDRVREQRLDEIKQKQKILRKKYSKLTHCQKCGTPLKPEEVKKKQPRCHVCGYILKS